MESSSGWTLLLTAILLGAVLFSLGVGAVPVPLKKVFSIFTQGQGTPEYAILFAVRFPRIVVGFAVGGGLAISGVILQGMFRNPLVEPYTLGISGGAALGVCFNIILRGADLLGPLATPLSGFLGALGIVLLVYGIGVKSGTMGLSRILLIGVMVSFMASSIIMLVMALTKAVVFVSVAGMILSFIHAVDLNALSLGEEEAFYLGVRIERLKKTVFVIASLLTGCCVAVAGVIGFVGLVIPHLMRLIVGGDHRILLVASYIAGAAFLILCDTLARVAIAPMELPVGVITGLVGGAVFIYALSKKRHFM
jgi:iron complex transport system permease protein